MPIDYREDNRHVDTTTQSCSAGNPLHRNAIYLRHVSDLLLHVLVRGFLLLHLVSQCGQRLVQGVGFPLGLENVRHGGMKQEQRVKKRSRVGK